MYLDDIDRKLLNLVQRDFPLHREPFAILGAKTGISSDAVLHRLQRLKTHRIVYEISPVIDARRLGYQATLAAMMVAPENVEKAAAVITSHSGVSHCHEREHRFNLWFTLALPAKNDIQNELARLSDLVYAEHFLYLPSLKLYKIGTYFDMVGDGWLTPVSRNSTLPKRDKLSSLDRNVINELQQDLPLVEKPFEAMAATVGLDTDQFLGECQSLQERGVMRRLGASINHIKAGFVANVLCGWMVQPDLIESAGKKIATFREVSHCFERQTSPLWKYNLYTVIHGRSREACQNIIQQICEETGLSEHVSLFSCREFKRNRIRYSV
ncbi:MAG TPA: AsnC family transcriptional regulator [Dehalococcoidales bacterium]|nr:AsnC family transcriptional regulator [Dehalococcoidales bacterium]